MSHKHILRVPQIDLGSLLTQQNPQIDLRLDAYETSTRNFLKAVTNYKNRAITTISNRRANQASEEKKLVEKTQLVEAEINQCKIREIELVSTLEREKEEIKEAKLSVTAFNRQLLSLKEKCASIEAEIEQYRAISENLRREKDKERLTLGTHSSHIYSELNACEHLLSCVIEGVEKDQLLVRFWNVDPSEPKREFSFVINVGGSMYKVITSSPPIPSLPILVDELNDSRDIYSFIKCVRNAYESQAKTNI